VDFQPLIVRFCLSWGPPLEASRREHGDAGGNQENQLE
jgi:hypothetical protein